MAAILHQTQIEFISMKQQLMEQLDDSYDARIALLQQQKRGMRLALKHMIDYQLHRILESLAEKNRSEKLDISTTTKYETNSLEVWM